MTTDKQIKEIRLRFLESMKEFNYPKWVSKKNNDYGLNLNFGGISHVAKRLTDLTMGYSGSRSYLDVFLWAIYKEKFIDICSKAGGVDIKALPIYADFVYNIIPVSLRIKKQKP